MIKDTQLRNSLVQDSDGISALQRSCFPEPFPAELLFQPHHIKAHIDAFPIGQWVVTVNDNIVASCTNMLITNETWDQHLDFDTITGGLALSNHNPQGQTLYGVDISVHPDYRGLGIAKALYQARFQLVKELNLTRYGTICRLPDFATSPISDIQQYAHAVVRHEVSDRTLSPLLKVGTQFVTIINDYMDDPESGNAGAVLEWKPIQK